MHNQIPALRRMLVAVVLLIVFCPRASADMGVPMLGLMWPAAWLLLVPIVLLEAWVAVRVLAVPFREGFELAGGSNLFSTALGIPVTWVMLLILGVWLGPGLDQHAHSHFALAASDALNSVWIFPDDAENGWQGWLVIQAAMILCVPFFLMSVAVEGWLVRKGVETPIRERVWRWAWQANLLSYGLIELVLGVMLILALRR